MRRYLIVDDNSALAANLAEIVEATGNAATLASGGAEALDLAKNERFDALVTDMRMPEVGGADLVHELRTVDPGLPVIVVTAFTSDDDLGRARRYGLLGILPKPVPIERLLALALSARRDAVVAIVDDDEPLAENLSEAFQQSGFATVVATSLADAHRIGAMPFVAVTDLRMPGGPDGKSVALMRERFPDTPLIVITGHHGVVVPPDIRAVFFKPFQVDQILEQLKKIHTSKTVE